MRAVYDTMLFLQAAVQPHRVHRSFRAVRDGTVTLCISRELLAEVHDVLKRQKVREKFPALTNEAVDSFIVELGATSQIFHPIPKVFTFPADPDDDHIFNLAIHAEADYLVTWETRILNLVSDKSETSKTLRALASKLRIVNPEQFAALLAKI